MEISKHHNGNPDSPFSSDQYGALDVEDQTVIYDRDNPQAYVQSDYSIQIQGEP
jgi:hypothetical protein